MQNLWPGYIKRIEQNERIKAKISPMTSVFFQKDKFKTVKYPINIKVMNSNFIKSSSFLSSSENVKQLHSCPKRQDG